MEHGKCRVHGFQYVTSLFLPILFFCLLFIVIYLCFSIIFSFFFFSFLFQLKQIFINKNELFEWIQTLSQPCSFSQCSKELQHLIRRSPIGTQEVSQPCITVHNISLFTHSLFFVYFLLLYIFVFSNFLILLFFFSI